VGFTVGRTHMCAVPSFEYTGLCLCGRQQHCRLYQWYL